MAKTGTFPLTLFEKVLSRSHLPLTFGTLIFGLFTGPLGNFIYLYAVSNNLANSLYRTFFSTVAVDSGSINNFPINWHSLAGNLLWYLFLCYVAFLPNHIRSKLVDSEKELLELAHNKKKDIKKNFKMISNILPQLTITLVFLFVYSTAVPDLLVKGELNVFSSIIYVLRSFSRSLMFGSVLWLYCASLYGLYRFGKGELKFKSYTEDLMLGTGKIGSISFSLSVAYFFGITIFAGQMILGDIVSQNVTPVNILAMLFLVPFGVVLFMAPLISIHKRMVEVKNAECTSTSKIISETINSYSEPGLNSADNMIKLMVLENVEKKANSIRTWPVESPVLGKLTIITLSVTATIIARIIQIIAKI